MAGTTFTQTELDLISDPEMMRLKNAALAKVDLLLADVKTSLAAQLSDLSIPEIDELDAEGELTLR